MRPAAVMGGTEPFAPPTGFWPGRGLLVVARVAFAAEAGAGPALAILGAARSADALVVEMRFASRPSGAYALKEARAIALDPPLPARIVVRGNGAVVCTLAPWAGHWREVGG